MTIVQNPGAPPEIAVPLLRLLIRPELQRVTSAADVPAVVRAAAGELLERRPPVPDRFWRAREPESMGGVGGGPPDTENGAGGDPQ